MSKVIMTCGKICCGKTTYSKEICKTENAVLLSVDELMIKLFGQSAGERHDEYVSLIKNYFLEKSVEIIKCGTSVVLDWGLWSRRERNSLRSFYSKRGIYAEIHYLSIDDDTWLQRIDERNKRITEGNENGYYIDDCLKRKFSDVFETPQKEEVDVWIDIG